MTFLGDKDYSSAETVPATLGAGQLVKLVLHWGGCFHRNPVNSNVFFRSQSIDECTCMVLNMADIVELEFYFLEGPPGKSQFCIQVHRRDLFLDFVFARVEVFENFIFAVRFSDLWFCMRRSGKVAEKLVVLPVLLPGNKLFSRFLQVQVCIEESVV